MWEWREEAFNHLMEGSVMLAEDCSSFVGSGLNGEQTETALKAALATKLSAPLYSTYISTRIEILRLEEYFLTQNADDVDEVREQITEVNLEEQMEAAASLGRLNVPCSVQCLANIWGQISSRLNALFQSSTTSSEVTPEAAALLEEACLLITCLCHLLTDDNTGETPLIPITIIEACMKNDTTTMIMNMIHSIILLSKLGTRLHSGPFCLSTFQIRVFLSVFYLLNITYVLLNHGSSREDHLYGLFTAALIWTSLMRF